MKVNEKYITECIKKLLLKTDNKEKIARVSLSLGRQFERDKFLQKIENEELLRKLYMTNRKFLSDIEFERYKEIVRKILIKEMDGEE